MARVLLVSGSLPPIKCGVGFYVQRLGQELYAKDQDFSVLTTADVNQEPFGTQQVAGWQVRRLPKLLSIIKNSNADIVHIQYPAVGYGRQIGINLLPYFLRLFYRKALIVVTLHEYFGSRWIGRLRDIITITPAHSIILTNRADAEKLPRRFTRKATIIPIGSSVDRPARNKQFFEKTLDKLGLEVNKKTLLYFGYAFPAKQLEILIDAMRTDALQGWQLLMLTSLNASNKYQKKLLDKIKEANKDFKRVAVTGFLAESEISSILQEGKYFVLPQTSPLTAKSSTAITAVQHNLILLSHSSSRPEISLPYSHLKNCYLIDEINADNIASAVELLENSSELRSEIKMGMKDLQGYFSWEAIIRQHLQLYEKLNG